MYERELQHMYQAWQQGNSDYINNWAKFVELAAKQTGRRADEIMSVLQKTYWFMWSPEE